MYLHPGRHAAAGKCVGTAAAAARRLRCTHSASNKNVRFILSWLNVCRHVANMAELTPATEEQIYLITAGLTSALTVACLLCCAAAGSAPSSAPAASVPPSCCPGVLSGAASGAGLPSSPPASAACCCRLSSALRLEVHTAQLQLGLCVLLALAPLATKASISDSSSCGTAQRSMAWHNSAM